MAELRSSLVEALREACAAERDVFAAIDPATRDAPTAEGGWSAKDSLAHLSAWRQRQALKLAALREGREEPALPSDELDITNAAFHAERADWAWERVLDDAEMTADALIGEVVAASDDVLTDPKSVGSIMGDGPEHDLDHLTAAAAGTGLEARVPALADATRSIVDRAGWPTRAAAYARYNLACYHAKGGRLDEARSLLRLALPVDEGLRAHAPGDDDLIAIRDEIAALAAG